MAIGGLARSASLWLAVFLATFLTASLLAPFIHVDHVRGSGLTASAWGVSVGTDTAYCSLDLNYGAGGAGLDAFCQRAG